jgi:RNA polymerase sigma-32 factor
MAKHLTKEEMNALATAAQKGNIAAQNKLITANMGMICVAAQKHVRFDGANRQDLINEGVIGMLESIPSYDPRKGVKFTTHAVHRVRMMILNRCMADHRMVKIGTSEAQRKLFWNLNKETAKCVKEGIKPTPEALAERIPGVNAAHVEEMQIRMGGSEDSLTKVVSSTDTGAGRTLFDTLASDTPDPDAYATDQSMKSWALNTMIAFEGTLTGHALTVWNDRIASPSPRTFKDIAKRAGVSRQRAQQIEADLRSRFTKFARKRS